MNTGQISNRSRQWLLVAAGVLLAGWLLFLLRGILAPVALAALLAYAFSPLVYRLEAHRWPRSLAALLCLLMLVILAAAIFLLVVPTIVTEIKSLSSHVPAYVEKFRSNILPWLQEHLGLEIGDSFSATLKSLEEAAVSSAKELALPAARVVAQVLSGVVSLIISLMWMILVPLFTYYFLVYYQQILDFFSSLIPPARRVEILDIISDIDRTLSSFLRGQGTVCLTLAAIYSVALTAAGIPAGVTIGVLSGIFNFIPYAGTITGIVLCCIFLLLEGASWSGFLWVAVIYTGVNIADGLLITPRILGSRLGLAPVAVILAVLAFGELFGFLGVLLAVPVTAILRVVLKRALKSYRQSRLFLADDQTAGGESHVPSDPGGK